MGLKRFVAKALRAILQPAAITGGAVDKTARVCSGSQVNFTTVSRYSYIGHDAFTLNAQIGPFCSIADGCRIGGAAHPTAYVSTSPVFHAGSNLMGVNFARHPLPEVPVTTIGPDVWIGANAVIKSGITIGCGAVIGAGSVVTHDVPPYEMWAGNPARRIRDRFDPALAQGLLNSGWWELSEEELGRYAPLFNEPEKFLSAIEGDKQ